MAFNAAIAILDTFDEIDDMLFKSLYICFYRVNYQPIHLARNFRRISMLALYRFASALKAHSLTVWRAGARAGQRGRP